MAQLIDPIDFRAYLQQTEASIKVRKAGAFFDDVRVEFKDREAGKRYAGMISTKARNLLQFKPGEVTAWAGYNGHKKSMFTSQVALDLCMQRERVLIASMEMSPAKTLARMARQAAGTARPDDRWLSAFEQWTDDRLWLFDHMGRMTPELAIALCRYFADELNGTHILIDSMMMVVGSEESMDEQKQFVTDLVRVAQECRIHAHLVTHCRKPQSGNEDRPPTKYDIRGSGAISDQAANVITVWANKAKKAKLEKDPLDQTVLPDPDAVVTIEKQRDDGWEGKLQLWFDEPSLRFIDDRMSGVYPYDLVHEPTRSLRARVLEPGHA